MGLIGKIIGWAISIVLAIVAIGSVYAAVQFPWYRSAWIIAGLFLMAAWVANPVLARKFNLTERTPSRILLVPILSASSAVVWIVMAVDEGEDHRFLQSYGMSMTTYNEAVFAYNNGLALSESGSNPAEAKALYEKACRIGFNSACINLAAYISPSEGAALNRRVCNARFDDHDFAQANDFSRKSGCYNLGIHQRRAGQLQDAERSFKKSCVDGPDIEIKGCGEAGMAILKGPALKGREQEAIALLNKGCASHDFSACLNLGIQYAKGEVVVRDLNEASTLATIACQNATDPETRYKACNVLPIIKSM